jgi:porin
MVLEANYNIPVYRGIQLQPEFEWFVHPGGVSTVPDAVVLGLKTHVLF